MARTGVASKRYRGKRQQFDALCHFLRLNAAPRCPSSPTLQVKAKGGLRYEIKTADEKVHAGVAPKDINFSAAGAKKQLAAMADVLDTAAPLLVDAELLELARVRRADVSLIHRGDAAAGDVDISPMNRGAAAAGDVDSPRRPRTWIVRRGAAAATRSRLARAPGTRSRRRTTRCSASRTSRRCSTPDRTPWTCTSAARIFLR